MQRGGAAQAEELKLGQHPDHQRLADHEGAILAATDSDILQFGKDTYNYCWPRDAALIAHAYSTAGYPETAANFFRFGARLVTPDGFFTHKYNPDGSPGSSWHPWFYDGEPQWPVQEDETALVVQKLIVPEVTCLMVPKLVDFVQTPLVQVDVDYRDADRGIVYNDTLLFTDANAQSFRVQVDKDSPREYQIAVTYYLADGRIVQRDPVMLDQTKIVIPRYMPI